MKNFKVNYLKYLIVFIILLGILLRLNYIRITGENVRQYDVRLGNYSHLDYIYHFLNDGLNLPSENRGQFYHPPFYHITSAAWVKLTISVFNNNIINSLQFLNCCYSILTLFISFKILKKLKVKDLYLLLILAILSLHPTFIIFSGRYNNDTLLLLFMMLTIYFTILWYNNSNFKNCFFVGLFLGLSGMTKLSGLVLGIPIFIIFMIKIMLKLSEQKYKDVIKYFIMLFLIIVISAVLGLWYQIYFSIRFENLFLGILIPIYPKIENISFINRYLFDIQELVSPFCSPYTDHNVLAYLLKTSIIGITSSEYNVITVQILKALNILIIIESLICMIKNILNIKKVKKEIFPIVIFFTSIWTILIISYLIFVTNLPYACSMDFRYIVPTIFTGMINIIWNLENSEKNKYYKLYLYYIITLITLFCIFSIIVIPK